MQYIDQLAHDIGALRETKLVTDGNTDSGSNLAYYLGVAVSQSIPDSGQVGVDGNSTGRAHNTALAAAYAIGIFQLTIKGGSDAGIGTTISKIDGIDALYVITDTNTVTTQDALVGVTDDGRRGEVQRDVTLGIFEAYLADTHAMGQLLQSTFATARAGGAIAIVRGQ